MKLRIKGFKVDARNAWEARQVKMFCEGLVEDLGGDGVWAILSRPLRKLAVAEKAFRVVRSQHKDAVEVSTMDALLNDMERLMGVSDCEI